MMEHTVVISKLEVIRTHCFPGTLFGQEFSRFEDLFDKYGPLTIRCEEVQILPQGTTHSAWYTNEVV